MYACACVCVCLRACLGAVCMCATELLWWFENNIQESPLPSSVGTGSELRQPGSTVNALIVELPYWPCFLFK